MGIFLDINEDNLESEGWRIERIRKTFGIPISKPQKFVSENCPICRQRFFNNTDLQNHLFHIHRHDINYQIIDQEELEQELEQEKELLSLNYSDIDDLFYELQIKINQGKNINWSKYKDILQNSNEHKYRIKYWKGLLEYISSHYFEIENKIVSNSYNNISEGFTRAYGYLEIFASKNKIAQQIRLSIALKMNWFQELIDASDSSLFFIAWHFFVSSYEVVKNMAIPLVKLRQQQGIMIDDFHQELLEVLHLYYCDRSNLTYRNVKKLELLSQNTNNPNYIDKLTLLKARIFREWENFAQAKQNYREIRNHLLFGEEARLFNDSVEI